jgi:hypothetical protein
VLVDTASASDAQELEVIVGEFSINNTVTAYPETLCRRIGANHVFNIAQSKTKTVDGVEDAFGV